MATKIFRALKLLLLLLIPIAAHATTYNISAGASLATIQSTITTAGQASGSNTVQFAAGLYSVAWGANFSQISIPCPSGSLTITGPTTTYDQPGILNAWAARPTATIRNTTTGESQWLISTPGACTGAITIQYLEIDGNRPQSGGGAIFISPGGAGPSAATSNVTIQYDWLHGNQEIVPTLCGNDCWAYEDNNATEIRLEGSHGGTANNGTYVNNINIVHNVFGNGSTANVDAGDCGHVMEFIGNCTDTTTGDHCNWYGYNSTGGQCAALGVQTSLINFHFDYNQIVQEEQGAKFYEGGSPYNGDGQFSVYFQVNSTMNYNNIGIYHRIGTEDQASSINYVGGFSANTDCAGSGSPNGNDCMTHFSNIMHDNYNPSIGNWGFSLANTGYRADNNNVMITNDNNGGGAGPGDIEDFATFNTVAQNLSQGYMGCAIQYGGDNNIALFQSGNLNNNQFQDINGAACGGSTQISFAINNAHGNAVQTNTGNTGTATVSKVNSVAPTFSPNGGSFGGSVVVTLSDAGLTSGAGPRGNTNLWCTTDNSTPAPASGTSVYYDAGSTITLTSTTTLKCVGMWGKQSQVLNIPSGYGYNPSSVVSATFTGGGTPTAAAPTFSPVSGSTFTSTQSVTLTSSTPSSTILYCLLSGCTPTTVYSGAISLSSTTTISAIATAGGFANSSVSQAMYTLVAPGQAATPVFSPSAPLTFTTPISVSITSSTPSNTIRYTTDGSTPTGGSTIYTGPVTVSATQTLKAIATASGFTTSNVGSATYTFSLFLGNNLQDNSTSNTYPGAFNGIYAVTGTAAAGYIVTGCTIDQGTARVTSGSHTACVLSAATSPTTIAANSLCSGAYTNTSTSGTIAQITITGCPTLAASTPYVISTITDDPLMPSALGFNDCGSSCTGGVPTVGVGTQASFYFAGTYGQYTGMTTTMNKGVDQLTAYLTLTPATTTTATPVISPTSGTITGATTISIADTTPSSSIFYTTDGSTPTPSSTHYTGTFSISATTTVKAIATASGMTNSAVASNIYTLSTGSISQLKLLTKSGVNYVIPGSNDQLAIQITYSDGFITTINAVGNQDIRNTVVTSWTSSNTNVATINSSGSVVGVSNTVIPNITNITAVVTDVGGTTHTVTLLEGVAFTLTAGIE